MNGHISKEIRNRLGITKDTSEKPRFYTTPVKRNGIVVYKFTYICGESRTLYKLAKKIWKKYKILPKMVKKNG